MASSRKFVMSAIRSVVVFCGAALGARPAYAEAAAALGAGLAGAGIRLVYGGGGAGLMGVVARAARDAGGTVVGVIPQFLMDREVAMLDVSEVIVTTSMHDRKRQMFDLAEAFVILPGGLGTLDEAVEIITWRQLSLHDKPILLCDVNGSAGPLTAAVEMAVAEGFAHTSARALFEVVSGPAAVLDRLATLLPVPGAPSARL
jgi:uncharacterized protein (TIGR00730 family)